MPSSYRAVLESILKRADVTVDGEKPWDIHVRDQGFFPPGAICRLAGYRRGLHGRSVGLRTTR